MALTVQIKEENNVFTVYPIGSIDAETSSSFEEEVDRILARSPQLIFFDLSRLEFITSTGIGVLIKTERFLSKNGGKLFLINLPPQIKKVIQIIKALPNLKMFKDRQEADGYLLSIQQSEIDKNKQA